MIKAFKIIFLCSLSMSFSLKAETTSIEESIRNLENQLLYGEKYSNFETLSTSSVDKLYSTYKSNTVSTNFAEIPLIIVFNKDFSNIKINEEKKEYIKNKNSVGFVPPNIVHLNSMHNRSFAYTFYENGFYDEPLKSKTQHLLFFHEMAHYYLYNNIDYKKEFTYSERQEYKFKFYIEESYADLFAVSFLTKLYNIEKKDINMFFDGLKNYREKTSQLLYKGNYSLLIYKLYYLNYYEEIMLKKDKDFSFDLYDINKKILLSNYKESLKNIIPEYKTEKDFIDIKDFFDILNTEKNKKINYEDIKNIFS